MVMIDPKAVWTGPPSQEVIRWILNNTHTDSEGRRFYRDRNGSFRRLISPLAFRELNERLAEFESKLIKAKGP